MLTPTAILIWLFQDGGAPSRPFRINCPPCLEDTVATGEERRREAQYEEQELLRRVNGLASALTDFSSTYSSRHVIDVKQIKAIRKALRELEKSDWLRHKDE
jgi:hypothetical protein